MGLNHTVANTGVVDFKKKGTIGLVIESGVSFPGSPSAGQIFRRSDLDKVYVYNGVSWIELGTGSGNPRIYAELVNETPDGVVTVFTVDNPYVALSTEITRNGLRLERGVDYTESDPATGEVTLTVAPSAGAVVLMSYDLDVGSTLPGLARVAYTVGTPSAPYSGSTTVFDLPFVYQTGTNSLFVYYGGVLMLEGVGNDYQETSSSQITFNSARTIGVTVQVIKLGFAPSIISGGSSLAIGDSITGATSTAVLFVDSSGNLAQDVVSDFFYDQVAELLSVNNLVVNTSMLQVSVEITTGTPVMASVDRNYVANSASLVSLALPTVPGTAYSSKVRLFGHGSGGWTITQGAGQIIRFGNNSTTLGVGGSLSSTNRYDCVELLQGADENTWIVCNAVGTIAVV